MPLRILIVDDDPLYRDLVSDVLETKQHIAIAVPDAYSALSVLKEQSIDLLISDVQMPGMDGLALFHEVRRTYGGKQLPFVFLTGITDKELTTQIKELPDTRLIPKSELVQGLSSLLTEL